jgi:pimeloyl-ACP methyl ester carboxylesterase
MPSQYSRPLLFHLFMAFFSLFSCVTNAQDPTPKVLRYEGQLEVGGFSLTMALRFKPESGIVLFDSIDENIFGLESNPVDQFPSKEFSLVFPSVGVIIQGVWEPDGTLTAVFEQGPASVPIVFVPKAEATKPPREARAVSLQEFEISVEAPKALLSVAISQDQTNQKPFVVLVINGSGPQDRDGAIFGQKTSLIMANGLYESGFRTVRFDERGQGKSTGDFGQADTFDLVEDITAILQELRRRYPASKIGAIGLSEGGLISTILAAQNKVDFAVLLAAPSSPGSEVLLQQTEAIHRANAMAEEEIQKIITLTKESHKLVLAMGRESSLYADTAEELQKQLIAFYQEKSNLDPQTISATARTLASPWFRTFLALDPLPYLEQIQIPILALTGTKDLQVLMDPNFFGIQRALEEREDFASKSFPDLNHLFQKAQSGSPAEYVEPNPMIEDQVLEVVTQWLDGLE